MTRAWATALALALAATAAAAGEGADCASVADDAQRLACYDARAGKGATPAAAATAAAPSPRFGLPAQPPPKADAMEARIAGAFTGWTRGQLIKLDNGQIWKCVDDRDGYYPNTPRDAEVTIQTSFFGGYWLEVQATGARLRVKRVK